MGKVLQDTKEIKILVPYSLYDLSSDKRLLIPFTSGEKLGFINREGVIIVKAKYNMYYGNIYKKDDISKVAQRTSNEYHNAYHYGVINAEGTEIFPPVYHDIRIFNNTILTIKDQNNEYSVCNVDKEVIVPTNKYTYIDGFYKGLARVKVGGKHDCICDGGKWGIINVRGEVVAPIKYNYIQPLSNNKMGKIYIDVISMHKEYIYLDLLK